MADPTWPDPSNKNWPEPSRVKNFWPGPITIPLTPIHACVMKNLILHLLLSLRINLIKFWFKDVQWIMWSPFHSHTIIHFWLFIFLIPAPFHLHLLKIDVLPEVDEVHLLLCTQIHQHQSNMSKLRHLDLQPFQHHFRHRGNYERLLK